MNIHTYQDKPVRSFLKFRVEKIAGDPCRRSTVVTDAFMQEFLQRQFDFARDYMHVPSNIDAPNGTAYVCLDINVWCDPAITAENVSIFCFKAEPSARGIS
jgi:hypothetical protein